jgi:hypothetical protein
MSARAGTQKYGKMVNINAFKLRQRDLLSRRLSTLSTSNGNLLFKKRTTRSSRGGSRGGSLLGTGSRASREAHEAHEAHEEQEEGRGGRHQVTNSEIAMVIDGTPLFNEEKDEDDEEEEEEEEEEDSGVTPDYSPVFEEFDDAPNSWNLPCTSVSRIDCVSEERQLLAVWTESLQVRKGERMQ